MNTISPTVNATIISHLIVMEHMLLTMLEHVSDAQCSVAHQCPEDAIIDLKDCGEGFKKLSALHDAMITVYDNAILLEHPEP